MFKQRLKQKKRVTACVPIRHVFSKNKSACLCGSYYKDNGRLLRSKGSFFVAGTTACGPIRHVFSKNKSACLCGSYYKVNGRLLRSKGSFLVAGTTADFHYKWERPTKKMRKIMLRKILKS